MFFRDKGERFLVILEYQWIPEFSWAFFNYRGYGLSQGVPSERALFQDALVIFDYLEDHPGVDFSSIFALGDSLGTGMASYLASQRPLRGAALFSPYDKIKGGVASDLIPLIPTSLLLKNGFDLTQHVAHAKGPVLGIVGGANLVIRPIRSHKLLDAWGQPVVKKYLPEEDHYSICELEESWHAVRDFFLGECQDTSGGTILQNATWGHYSVNSV